MFEVSDDGAGFDPREQPHAGGLLGMQARIRPTSAETITKDPREMELRFQVELLEEIVQDERLGRTTTQAAIDGLASRVNSH